MGSSKIMIFPESEKSLNAINIPERIQKLIGTGDYELIMEDNSVKERKSFITICAANQRRRNGDYYETGNGYKEFWLKLCKGVLRTW